MSKTKGYTNAPADIAEELENSVAIDDFLPSPESIAAMLKKQDTVPVTMKLKKTRSTGTKDSQLKREVPDLRIYTARLIRSTAVTQ